MEARGAWGLALGDFLTIIDFIAFVVSGVQRIQKGAFIFPF